MSETEAPRTVRAARAVVVGVRFVLTAGVLGFVALLLLAPRLGYRTVIIRGPSMSPTIPLGSLVFERAPREADVHAGSVVTFTTDNGVVVTHRVLDVDRTERSRPCRVRPCVPGGRVDASTVTIATKGDANADPDPTRIPLTSVTGVVDRSVPVLGFVLAWSGFPSSRLALASFVGLLLVIEELLARWPEWASTDHDMPTSPVAA